MSICVMASSLFLAAAGRREGGREGGEGGTQSGCMGEGRFASDEWRPGAENARGEKEEEEEEEGGEEEGGVVRRMWCGPEATWEWESEGGRPS